MFYSNVVYIKYASFLFLFITYEELPLRIESFAIISKFTWSVKPQNKTDIITYHVKLYTRIAKDLVPSMHCNVLLYIA